MMSAVLPLRPEPLFAPAIKLPEALFSLGVNVVDAARFYSNAGLVPVPLKEGVKESAYGGPHAKGVGVPFKPNHNIATLGCALLDFDNKPEKGKPGPTLRETMEAFAALFPGVVLTGLPIVLTPNFGMHIRGQAVPGWRTKTDIAVKGAAMDVICGHQQKMSSGKDGYSLIGVAPPTRLSAKPNSPYAWLRSFDDPEAIFLRHTGYASLDEVPEFYRGLVKEEIEWRTARGDVNLGVFPPEVVARIGNLTNPTTEAKTNSAPKTNLLDEPVERLELVKRAAWLDAQAREMGFPELSPLNHSQDAWLLWASLAAYEMGGVDNPECSEMLYSACRDEGDRKRVAKSIEGRTGQGLFCEVTDPLADAAKLLNCCNAADNRMREPTLAKLRGQLSDIGLKVMRTSRGNVAVDLSEDSDFISVGAEDYDVESRVLNADVLKSYNFLGHQDFVLADYEEALGHPPKMDLPLRMKKAADHFLCQPTDYKRIELLPMGIGPFAVHPDDAIPASPTTLRRVSRATVLEEKDLLKDGKWMDNPDLRFLLDRVYRHYAPTDEEWKWLVSFEARSFQNPYRFSPTAPLLMGATRSGKNSIIQATNACFSYGCLVVLAPKLAKNFNKLLFGAHRVLIDEINPTTAKKLGDQLKSDQTAEFIEIELKGKDTFQCRNTQSRIISTNENSLGLFGGGGHGRWQMFRNFEKVLGTGGAYEFSLREFGKLVQDPTQRTTTRHKEFVRAYSSFLANFECIDTDNVFDSTARVRAMEDEQQSSTTPNKVALFFEWLEMKVRNTDLAKDGKLYFVPQLLQDLAGQWGFPDVEGRVGNGSLDRSNYGPVLLNNKFLVALLIHTRKTERGISFDDDNTGSNNFKFRAEDVRMGGERVYEQGKNGNIDGEFRFDRTTPPVRQEQIHGKTFCCIDIATIRKHQEER